MVLGNFSRELLWVRLAQEWGKCLQKNNKNWYMRLVDLYVPNKLKPVVIQRVVTDGPMYDNAGVLRTVNVNWNDDGWNVNANPVENSNRWNDGNHVFSRNYCFFSLVFMTGEFLFANLFSIHQVVFQSPQVLKENPNIYLLV